MDHEQGARESNNNMLLMALLIGLLLLLILLPEYLHKNFYFNIWRNVKVFELWLYNNTLAHFMPAFISDGPALYYDRLTNLQREHIRHAHIADTEYMTLMRYGFVVPVLLFVYAFKTIMIKYECRGALNLESLIEIQSRTFPFIKHNIVHNPLKDKRLDVTRGRYAMRIKPLEHSKREGFITLDPSVTDLSEQRYLFHEDVFMKKNLATMGDIFTNVEAMRQEEQWMMAAFLTFLDGNIDGYHELLGKFSTVHYWLVKDQKIATKMTAKVDKECINLIKGYLKPSKLEADLKETLKEASYGDDVVVVVRDVMRVLGRHNGLQQATRILGGYFLDEYKQLKAKSYTSPSEYTTYERAEYLPLPYKAFLATGIMQAKGETREAYTLAENLIALLKTEKLLYGEELELEEIENQCEVVILTHMEQTSSDLLKDAIQKHHYTHGVILRLYKECGSLGVITANRFNWLQLVNKRLFLLLDDHGMPEGSAEVTFSRAHFDQEIKAGRKLKKPEVHQQVEEFKKRLLERVKIA